MRQGLSELLGVFSALRVLVMGDPMLDRYTRGEVRRLCPEAPAPVMEVTGRHHCPGGAANTAVNLRALGASVTLLAPFGRDSLSRQLRRRLKSHGVELADCPPVRGRSMLLKERLLVDGRVMMRIDQGTASPLPDDDAAILYAQLAARFANTDIVILSDYGYGAITPFVMELLGEARSSCAGVFAVDAKQLDQYASLQPTVVKPNFRQAVALMRQPETTDGSRADHIVLHADELLLRSGADIAAVTLDCDGAVICRRGAACYRTFCRDTGMAHASGAGDTFLAAFCLALAAGGSSASAAEIASAAAAVVVRRTETASCSWHELYQQLHGGRVAQWELAQLGQRCEQLRRAGKRIVMTCGCFDILHRGHITYLQQAKALGDVLVVGINSDESIARLKGPERPINTLDDRLDVLASLSCVDHLIPFSEDTPRQLIEAIRPDVFVKGGDYTRERLREAELVESLGGRVEILPYIENRSTTRIIDRIRATRGNDALALLPNQAG